MAGGKEAEVDRMVVRLIGDASSYQKMMKQAETVTKQVSKSVDAEMKRIKTATTFGGGGLGSAARQGFMGSIKGLQADLKQTESSFTRFTNRTVAGFKTMAASAINYGRTLAMSLTLPIVGFGVASVKSFSNFDKAMTESLAIMKTSGDQVQRMRDLTLSLSTGGQTKQSAKELAEAYFFLASAGKDAEQSMALLPKVAKFATAGAFDMAKATDLLTDAQSALGLSSKDAAKDMENMGRLGDVLVKANVLANASVMQFSEAITNDAGAAMKSFNIDLEEGVAVLAAMADQGNKGVAAGSEFARMIRLLSVAAIENRDVFHKYNITVFDGAGKLRNMADIVGDMEVAFKGMHTEQKIAALEALGFTALTQRAILPIIGTSKSIRRYEEELRKAGGTTDDVANKQMKSFANQMTVLKNRVNVAAIELGEKLAPMVGKLGKFIADTADKFRALTPAQQDMIIKIGLAVAALGPFLIALKGVVVVLGALKLLITGGIFGLIAIGIGYAIEKSMGWDKVIKGWIIGIEKTEEAIDKVLYKLGLVEGVTAENSGVGGMAGALFAADKAKNQGPSELRKMLADTPIGGMINQLEIMRDTAKGVMQDLNKPLGESGSAFIRDPAKEAEMQEKMAKAVKGRDEAEKKALKTQQDRAKAMADSIQMMKDEAALFGKSAKEIALYRAEQMGATADQKAVIASIQDQIAEKEKAKEATDKAKEATDEAREAEKRFRDSFKTGGIEGVGRGLDALARLEESRMGRASTSKKTMEATILAETSGKGGGGKTAANPLANVAAFLNPEQQKMELLYLKLISEDTKRQADKETVTLKPAGLGRSGS